MSINKKVDIFPRVTNEYVLAGNQQHLGGWWYKSELLHIIKCAKNTLKLYDKENITDDYIKYLDAQALNEEFNSHKEQINKQKEKVKDDLYLILDTSNQKLKIGRSKNVQKRLKQLQTSNSGNLKLLFVIKQKGCMEEIIHKKFNHLRITREWFDNDGSIIEYFSKNSL